MFDNKITSDCKKDLLNRVEHIEAKEEQKKEISAEIKEAYDSLKSAGYDAKTVKEMIKLRKKDKASLENEEEMRELYKDVLIK